MGKHRSARPSLLPSRLVSQHVKKVQLIMTCESCSKKRALHDVMVKICGFDPSREDFQDIFRRDNASAPRADLYVAGYPCPSYSRMGKREGTNDVRGMVTLQGLLYIATKRPRALVLEQVAALMQDKKHRQVWNFLQKVLTALDYTFAFDVVNTRHMGIPQSRPRLYIFAVCRESVTGPLSMPTAREHHPDLHTFMNKEGFSWQRETAIANVRTEVGQGPLAARMDPRHCCFPEVPARRAQLLPLLVQNPMQAGRILCTKTVAQTDLPRNLLTPRCARAGCHCFAGRC